MCGLCSGALPRLGVGAVLLYSAGQRSAGSPQRRPGLCGKLRKVERDSGDLFQGPMIAWPRAASKTVLGGSQRKMLAVEVRQATQQSRSAACRAVRPAVARSTLRNNVRTRTRAPRVMYTYFFVTAVLRYVPRVIRTSFSARGRSQSVTHISSSGHWTPYCYIRKRFFKCIHISLV